MKTTTKYHQAQWAPHEGAIGTLRKETAKIEADGGELFSIIHEAPGSMILVAKYPLVQETATQDEADQMIASGEAEIPAEAVVEATDAPKKSGGGGRRRNR